MWIFTDTFRASNFQISINPLLLYAENGHSLKGVLVLCILH